MQKDNPYLSNNLTGLLALEHNLYRRIGKFAPAAAQGDQNAIRIINRNYRRLAKVTDAIADWFVNNAHDLVETDPATNWLLPVANEAVA